MDFRKMIEIGKRAFLGLALWGMILYGGGCSFRTIGAYLLSDFLRGGNTWNQITDAIDAPGLDSVLDDLSRAAN